MNKKIVFLDIDGTLAVNNRAPLSTVRSCRAARKNGHLLYICTGRSRSQISRRILGIGFDGVISSGGAYVQEGFGGNGKVLYEAAMSLEVLRPLIESLNSCKAAYTVETAEKLIPGPYFSAFFKTWKANPFGIFWALGRVFKNQIFRLRDGGDGVYTTPVRKVVFWGAQEITIGEITAKFGESCELFKLSIPLKGVLGLEISPKGVHKGAAMEKVVQYYGLNMEDSIAFGDSDNDRTMLAMAGAGVAMGDGDPALKAVADYVTDPVFEDGIEKAFKKYGLV
ncbi:MAG: Cof-type HAD-IIB family hydrolase [Spirochaetaceae bacterium]|nr:Cof-type HAD-IIB family hydrolase [Spirochaetaceae bacterium]